MTIEIHQPELEALIQQRLDRGAFRNLEEILLQALKALPSEQGGLALPKLNFADFLMASFWREPKIIRIRLSFERFPDRYERHFGVRQAGS